MKLASKHFLLIAFLLSSFAFYGQEQVYTSNSKNTTILVHKHSQNLKKDLNKNTLLLKEEIKENISYKGKKKELSLKAKKKSELSLKTTEVSVPRTTIDFF
ncbi:hypothetical protein [Aquimarina sp. MMG016]|uniref:hypothetical protein n=1 Tax=Aquimarina sp. MMG016 TaxID=2822690 RepID=UPI001B3A20F4|nr:hypothetical protein [Aquimarina sp. MMG016]MBQ4821601.1 hypothetical protein [Aquimarina sp. MMG016]